MSQPLSDIASIMTILSGTTVMGSIAFAVWKRARIAEYLARVAEANGRPRTGDIESATRRIEDIGGNPETVAHEAGRALGSAGMNRQAENMYEMESYARRRSQSPSPARSSNGEGSSGQRPGSRQSRHSASRQSQSPASRQSRAPSSQQSRASSQSHQNKYGDTSRYSSKRN